jgi:hypothetical protein
MYQICKEKGEKVRICGLAEVLSPLITKKIGSINRKSAQCQMICGFAICGPPTFGVVHKLHIIYTLVNHGISIYKVKRDINNNISNLKCK